MTLDSFADLELAVESPLSEICNPANIHEDGRF